MGINRKDCGFISPVVSGCEIALPMYQEVCRCPSFVQPDQMFFDGASGCLGTTGRYVLPEPVCNIVPPIHCSPICDKPYKLSVIAPTAHHELRRDPITGELTQEEGSWAGQWCLWGDPLCPCVGWPGPEGKNPCCFRDPPPFRPVHRLQQVPEDCYDITKTWDERIKNNPLCSCVKVILETGEIPLGHPMKRQCQCIDPDPNFSCAGRTVKRPHKLMPPVKDGGPWCWETIAKCRSYCGECRALYPCPHPCYEHPCSADPSLRARTVCGVKGIFNHETQICEPCESFCGECGIEIPSGIHTENGWTYSWVGGVLEGILDRKICKCRRCEGHCGECMIDISVYYSSACREECMYVEPPGVIGEINPEELKSLLEIRNGGGGEATYFSKARVIKHTESTKACGFVASIKRKGIWDSKNKVCRMCEPNPFPVCGFTYRKRLKENISRVEISPPDSTISSIQCAPQVIENKLMNASMASVSYQKVPIYWINNTEWRECDRGKDGYQHQCGECRASLLLPTGGMKFLKGMWLKGDNMSITCKPCTTEHVTAAYFDPATNTVKEAVVIAEDLSAP